MQFAGDMHIDITEVTAGEDIFLWGGIDHVLFRKMCMGLHC